MPSTLIGLRDMQWAEAVFRRYAQALLGETVAVRFVDDRKWTEPTSAVAVFKPAMGLKAARIELRESLLRDPDEAWVSFLHECAHAAQRKMPRHRRKSWSDEEFDAEVMGRRLANKAARAARKRGSSLGDLLKYPDD